MRYQEWLPPRELESFVAAAWTLDCEGHASEEIVHNATPDGCIELVRRTSGRSRWRRDQPEIFAAGLSAAPIDLRLSGDAGFLGIRFWPWAWNALHETPCRDFADDWLGIAPGSRLAGLFQAMPEPWAMLSVMLAGIAPHPIGLALRAAESVGDVASRSGYSHRSIQRWCECQLGTEPRRYLRQVRFGRAMKDVQDESGTLADRAAANGFADQAHMAREFRALAGTPAAQVRARGKGPFVGR